LQNTIVKQQIPDNKYQINPNDLNSKSQTFGHWILEFVIYLRFGAWDLAFLRWTLRAITSHLLKKFQGHSIDRKITLV